MGGREEKDYEKGEEQQSYKKRKSSFKEMKRQSSIAVKASIQKLLGEKERYY